MTFYKPDTLKSTAICALAAVAFTATPAFADHHKEPKAKKTAQDKMKSKDNDMMDKTYLSDEQREMMEEAEETRMEMMEEAEEARMEMMEEQERVRMEMRESRQMDNGIENRRTRVETRSSGYVFSQPVRQRLMAGGLTEAQIAEREARLRAQFEQMARSRGMGVRPMSQSQTTTTRTSPSTMTTTNTTSDTSTDMSSGTMTTTTVETTTSTTVACPEGTVAQDDGTCMMTD